MSTPNNNPKGILLILLGMAFFSIQDSLIKYIFEESALYELYFGRTLTALILLTVFLKITSQKLVFKTHYPLLTCCRVICFFFGFSFFYISLTYMSLAMANALFFSSPFFISILAIIFLGEKVGIRRWLAIIVGFIGVYIVLNPDIENFITNEFIELLKTGIIKKKALINIESNGKNLIFYKQWSRHTTEYIDYYSNLFKALKQSLIKGLEDEQ